MQHKHRYILIFGSISIFYLMLMIVIGSIKDNTSNAANRAKDQIKVITGASVDRILDKKTTDYENEIAGAARPVTQSAVAQEKKEVVATEPVHTVMPSPEPTVAPTPVPTPKPTENPLFRNYQGLSKARKDVVNLAQSYAKKISYLWGGKASDSDIAGKTDPKELDCSGFIQFVYSKVKGKRISSLGATISISGLGKIGKSALKPGDIGLKRGKGSLYYDADGNVYAEPEKAERYNEQHVRSAKDQIKLQTERIEEIEDLIEEKKEKIEGWKEDKKRIYKKAKKLGVSGVKENKKTFILEESLEDGKEQILFDKFQKKFAQIQEKIEKCREMIADLREKKKECPVLIKEAKKDLKKYKKKIIRKIDHVGIYCGKDKNGREIWCHCSSSNKGVVIEHTDVFRHYFCYFKN